MKSKVCSLWLMDERDNALKIRATQAMSEEYLKERSLKLRGRRGVCFSGEQASDDLQCPEGAEI
jgi:hypothetical protein